LRSSGFGFGGALLVEFKEAFQYLVVGQIIRPAIGGEYGGVEGLVEVIEPLWTLVI
jgi:hypothetical protein